MHHKTGFDLRDRKSSQCPLGARYRYFWYDNPIAVLSYTNVAETILLLCVCSKFKEGGLIVQSLLYYLCNLVPSCVRHFLPIMHCSFILVHIVNIC